MTIQEMSTEALINRKKMIMIVTATLGSMLVMLLIAAIFLCVRQSVSIGFPLLIVVFALSPTLYTNLNEVRLVRRELQTRN